MLSILLGNELNLTFINNDNIYAFICSLSSKGPAQIHKKWLQELEHSNNYLSNVVIVWCILDCDR